MVTCRSFPKSSVWLAFFLAWVAAPLPAFALKPLFKRFPETISPNGKYVLAWGESDSSIKLSSRQEVAPGEVAFNVDLTLDNYLVDLSTKKIVSVLPNMDYFSVEEGHKNHAGLRVAWAPDSSAVVIIYDQRYGNESLSRLKTSGAIQDFRPSLEKCLRRLARAKYGKAAETKRTYVDFSHFAFLSPSVAVCDVALTGFISKSEDVIDDLGFHLKFQFPTKGAEVELLSGRSIPKFKYDHEFVSDPEGDLNQAYEKLRAKLAPGPKEALKQEQLRWLKLRDDLPEGDAVNEITRQRTDELRARAHEL